MVFKTKNIAFFFIAILCAIFLVVIFFWYLRIGKKSDKSLDSSAVELQDEEIIYEAKTIDIEEKIPPILEQELEYKILAIKNQGSYLGVNVVTGEEVNLLVPSDVKVEGSEIKPGSILLLKKYRIFENGVLVFEAKSEN